MESKRKKDTYLAPKVGRKFYFVAVYLFGIIAVLSFVNCIISGFTDERIAVILMNLWFMLFTMDIVTIRFKRKEEKAYWHDWFIFSKDVQIMKEQQDKTQTSSEIQDIPQEEKSNTINSARR